MKDGRTHLAHKAEHAVDLETGAIVGVTVQGADQGDTTTIADTVTAAAEDLEAVATATDDHTVVIGEVVADKGYHSNQVLVDLAALDLRTYIAEPDRGRRRWTRNPTARDAVYANRRRIRGRRGRVLQRRRSDRLERPNAHLYETGAMRRTHLRGHGNILKRLYVHIGGFNLGLLMRTLVGVGTPRGLQGRVLALVVAVLAPWRAQATTWASSHLAATIVATPSRRIIDSNCYLSPRNTAFNHGLLGHLPLAEFRLGGVDVGAVALRVDEGIHRVLCRLARDELAVPAPRSRARRHPDVNGKAAEHADAALEVAPLFCIPHPSWRTLQGAGADHVQYAFTVADGKRPRGAAARAAASDVRGERDRPDTDRVAVLEPVIDARRRESEDPDLDESPERQGDVGVVAASGDDASARFTRPQRGA